LIYDIYKPIGPHYAKMHTVLTDRQIFSSLSDEPKDGKPNRTNLILKWIQKSLFSIFFKLRNASDQLMTQYYKWSPLAFTHQYRPFLLSFMWKTNSLLWKQQHKIQDHLPDIPIWTPTLESSSNAARICQVQHTNVFRYLASGIQNKLQRWNLALRLLNKLANGPLLQGIPSRTALSDPADCRSTTIKITTTCDVSKSHLSVDAGAKSN